MAQNCPSDAWQGQCGFVVSFSGKNFLPIIFDETTLYKIVDVTLKFFADNEKSGERFRNMLERVDREKFISEVEAVTHES